MWRLIRNVLPYRRRRLGASQLSAPETSSLQTPAVSSQVEDKFIWCLVGNIVDGHFWGEEKELKRGAKVFAAGAKLYCYPVRWGDGYQKIYVTGMHRKRKCYITMIIDSRLVTNYRSQKVFKPAVLKEMKKWGGWDSSDYSKETILEMLKYLPGKKEPTE